MKEQVKTGLLAGIAVLTLANTVMLASVGNSSSSEGNDEASKSSSSNVTATKRDRDQNRDQQQNPRQQQNKRNQQQNQEPQNPPTTIEFEKYEHDFGKVKAGEKNTKNFKFTNTGDKPYVIQNAKGSCGCTVPSYPKEPIAPGETGEIQVSYKPGQRVSGKQTNNVTLTGNTEPRQTKLKISANVQSGSSS